MGWFPKATTMQHLMHLILFLLLVTIEFVLFFVLLYMLCLFEKEGVGSHAWLNILGVLQA